MIKLLIDLKELLKGDDKDAIEAKTKELTEHSGKLAERTYAQKSAEGAAAGGEHAEQASAEKPKDDVVDAEFEEVKNDKDKE